MFNYTHTRTHIWGVGFNCEFKNKIAAHRKPRSSLPFDCFACLSGQRNLPSGSSRREETNGSSVQVGLKDRFITRKKFLEAIYPESSSPKSGWAAWPEVLALVIQSGPSWEAGGWLVSNFLSSQ